MKSSVVTGVLAFAAFAPATARALPRLVPDVVAVDDGSRWRGVITELVEGDHVTVKRANGEVVRIRWDAITCIEREGRRIPLPGPLVHVHFDAPEDAALERFDPFTREHTLICYAPCDREMPSGLLYRLRGESIRGSRHFELKDPPGHHVHLEVDGASNTAFYGGVAVLSLGGVVTIVGMIRTVGGVVVAAWRNDQGAEKKAETTGTIVMASGTGIMLGGAALIVANAASSVHQLDPSTRTPTWTKPVVPEGTRSSFAVPLVAITF